MLEGLRYMILQSKELPSCLDHDDLDKGEPSQTRFLIFPICNVLIIYQTEV